MESIINIKAIIAKPTILIVYFRNTFQPNTSIPMITYRIVIFKKLATYGLVWLKSKLLKNLSLSSCTSSGEMDVTYSSHLNILIKFSLCSCSCSECPGASMI